MNIAGWAWILLLGIIAGYVIGYDLWAQATGNVTMSEQFHVWMQSQWLGPIVVALWLGASFGLFYHFLINK